MPSRTVEIECDSALAGALADAVSAYAAAAFPDGGSECAQVSREALETTAAQCATHTGGRLSLRKRQLAPLRAAVDWYFTEVPGADPAAGQSLTRLLAR